MLIGTLLGTAAGLVAKGIADRKARAAANKADNMVQNELDFNQAWHDRRYNEDYTQRADAQRLINMTLDRIKEWTAANSARKKTGGLSTQEAAADKETASKMLADTTSQIASNGLAEKARVDSQYMANRSNLTGQQIARQDNHAAGLAKSSGDIATALLKAGAGYDEYKEAEKNRDWLRGILNQA